MRRVDTRSLRWLGVLVPLAAWGGWELVRALWWGQPLLAAADWVELLLIGGGATWFASWVAAHLERHEAEIRRRSDHLEALRSAGLALTTELELDKVLQQVVDQGRLLVGAQYSALVVLGADGRAVDPLYTSGVASGAHRLGAGWLGGESAADSFGVEEAAGPSEKRPLIGVELCAKGRRYGTLYLADKQGTGSGGSPAAGFGAEDEELLRMFALQAAIAVENAQLYRENQQIAVLRERERIGMDLHDGVIQSIYAIGLLLDDARRRLDTAPEQARGGIDTALHGLNGVIADIRNYIQHLRPQRFQGRDIRQGLEALAQELRDDTGLAVELLLDKRATAACSPRQANEFLHIAQEALANVRRHAAARRVNLGFVFQEGLLQLRVVDDGVGLVQGDEGAGEGLRNMRVRARGLHGEFQLSAAPGRGVCLSVTAPIEAHLG
jgi:signal transduction histidine kinase